LAKLPLNGINAMSPLHRRAALKSGIAATAAFSLVNTLPSPFSNPPLAQEDSDALPGDPRVITNWMRGWMGGDKSSTGPLLLARFADPFYMLTSDIIWSPNIGQEKEVPHGNLWVRNRFYRAPCRHS
jgi:hypothetical protein